MCENILKGLLVVQQVCILRVIIISFIRDAELPYLMSHSVRSLKMITFSGHRAINTFSHVQFHLNEQKNMQFVVEHDKASKCDTNCPLQLYLCSSQCIEICKDLKHAFSYILLSRLLGILLTLWHRSGFGIGMEHFIHDIMNAIVRFF